MKLKLSVTGVVVTGGKNYPGIQRSIERTLVLAIREHSLSVCLKQDTIDCNAMHKPTITVVIV